MDVKTLCLGVLSQRAMSGYEIKKEFEEAFRHFFAASYGSIYPALAELSRQGMVAVTNVEQSKRPDKKIYTITSTGLDALKQELGETAPKHKVRSEFLVMMYFAHLLTPEKTTEAIEQMIEHWELILHRDMESFEQSHKNDNQPLEPGMEFALGFGRTVLSAAIAYVRRQQPALARRIAEKNNTLFSDAAKNESIQEKSLTTDPKTPRESTKRPSDLTAVAGECNA